MLRPDAIGPAGLCVFMCILSSLIAMAVWSFCKFWAHNSKRAARRGPRRKEDVDLARRRTTSGLAASRAHVYEAPQPPRGASASPPTKSGRPAFRRHVSDGTAGSATASKKPGGFAKALSAPLESTDCSDPRSAEPRSRPLTLPRSGSLDPATETSAYARWAKARDTHAWVTATTPAQLTDRSEPEPASTHRHSMLLPRSGSFDPATAAIAHGRSAEARENAPATAPGRSTGPSHSEPEPARSRRHSMPLPRPGHWDQAIAHGRAAAEATVSLSAAAGGPPVPGSTSPAPPSSPSAPGGHPPRSLERQTSFERMTANDRDCPQTPGIPSPRRRRSYPANLSNNLNCNAGVRRRLSDLEGR